MSPTRSTPTTTTRGGRLLVAAQRVRGSSMRSHYRRPPTVTGPTPRASRGLAQISLQISNRGGRITGEMGGSPARSTGEGRKAKRHAGFGSASKTGCGRGCREQINRTTPKRKRKVGCLIRPFVAMVCSARAPNKKNGAVGPVF